MTPSDYARRIAQLEAEAQDLEAASDLAAGRGLTQTARYHKAEADRVRVQVERLRGEMLTVSARMLDADDKHALHTIAVILRQAENRAEFHRHTFPLALAELKKIVDGMLST